MAQIKDVIVDIKKVSSTITAEGFGKLLILSTELGMGTALNGYKEFKDMAEVKFDFAESSLAYKAADIFFAQIPKPDKVAIANTTKADVTVAEVITFLDEVNSDYSDWYYLVSTNQTTEYIAALSTWVKDKKKMFFYASANPTLEVIAEDRAVQLFHSKSDEFTQAGWIGECITHLPGSVTWKFKHIEKATSMVFENQVQDIGELIEANINTYTKKYGIDQTTEGLCVSGEYIDIVISIDYVANSMEARVARVLVESPRVPYTNEGISIIASAVEYVLKDAQNRNIIVSYTVDIPRMEDVPVQDIEVRKLNKITWTATLTGTIHEVHINGIVAY